MPAVVLGISERASSFVDPTTSLPCEKLGDADAQSTHAWKLEAGSLTNYCDAMHFWSLHPGGANFIVADGSVRFCGYDMLPSVQRAMATRAGDEGNQK